MICNLPLFFSFFFFVGHSADTAMVNGDGAHEHTEEAESKQDGSGDADGGEDSNEQEVIVIQDTGFTVKIQAPGTEPFDLQVRISSLLGLTDNSSMWENVFIFVSGIRLCS